jgi:exopolysaccharide biosynthesis WecB/TagA/CpsF family protein
MLGVVRDPKSGRVDAADSPHLSQNESDMTANAAKRSILDVDVLDLDWPQALDFAARAMEGDEQVIFAFLNANNANIAMRDRAYFDVLGGLHVLPDGIGVDIASKALYGQPFPANLNGTDFVPALLTYVTRPKRVALLGAKRAVFEAAIGAFAAHAPWHAYIPIADGYFDRGDSAALLDRIAAAKPDLLLVAMGSPAQELWIAEHIRPEHGRLVMGVGALFDFVAGRVPRAPPAMRAMRLEWLFRLWVEPGRLWRRYILGNPVFLLHVLRHKMRIRRGSESGQIARRAGFFRAP